MSPPIELWLRNSDMELVGQIETFTHFQATIRANDSGEWQLDCAGSTLAGEQMRMDPHMACGPVLRRGATEVLMSGYTRRVSRVDAEDGQDYTISGYDEQHLLWERLAHPDPAAPTGGRPLPDGSLGFNATFDLGGPRAADQAAAEFVDYNAGWYGTQLVGHGERWIHGLYTTGSGSFGPVISTHCEWGKVLGTLVQEICIAGGGLRWWIEDALDGQHRYFHVAEHRDLREVLLFSMDLQTMRAQAVDTAAPLTNYVWGGDDSIAGLYRLIQEAGMPESVARYGRSESYTSQRNPGSSVILAQAIQHMLAEGQEELSIEITPTESLLNDYGERWRLGDRCRVGIDGVILDAVITEAVIDMTPDGATITPTITTSGLTPAVRSLLGRMGTRVAALESGTGGWTPGDIKPIVGDVAAQGIEWQVANGDGVGIADLRGRYPVGVGTIGGAARAVGDEFGSDGLTAHKHAETVHKHAETPHKHAETRHVHAETPHQHAVPEQTEWLPTDDTGNVPGGHGASKNQHKHPAVTADWNDAHDSAQNDASNTADNAASNTADNAAHDTADNPAAYQVPPSTAVIYMQRVTIP